MGGAEVLPCTTHSPARLALGDDRMCAILRYVYFDDVSRVQLHHDYEAVCASGLRQLPTDPELKAAVSRLAAVELVLLEGNFLTLQRPEYGTAGFPPESLPQLQNHYLTWLHAEEASIGEQLLYGQNGFWQHWFNLTHEQSEAPLHMDLVLPDVAEMDQRDWMQLMNHDLMAEVLNADALRLRLLVPPRNPEGAVGSLASFTAQLGFEVRVRSSPFLFAVYAGQAAVVSERGSDGTEEGYFLTRRPAIVDPLQRVFDEHWGSAVPWESFVLGTTDVLELMSLGWTDTRIAEAMGLSVRTVSRRVADAMTASGVSSRFELGIKYARSRA